MSWKWAGGIFVLLVSIVTVSYWLIGDPNSEDPFDRIKLVGTVSDFPVKQHAAIFEYYHAESGATGMALWLLGGEVNNMANEMPKGNPTMLWPLGQCTPRISWQPNGRLLVEVAAPIDLSSDLLWRCYDPPLRPERPYMCISSSQIDVSVEEGSVVYQPGLSKQLPAPETIIPLQDRPIMN